MRELTLQQAAQTALDVQTACNLSGVVHSFAEITVMLRTMGLDTSATNTHPICRLFAEQILHLTGGGTGEVASYVKAYAACTALAKAQPQPAPVPPAPKVPAQYIRPDDAALYGADAVRIQRDRWREDVEAALALAFGHEWAALDALDQTLIVRDCTEDGGVSNFGEYAHSIGRGNLASYAKTQRVRFRKESK